VINFIYSYRGYQSKFNILSKNKLKDKPKKDLPIIKNIKIIKVFEVSNSIPIKVAPYIDIPIEINIEVFFKNLKKCHASVTKTKYVVEPQNLLPCFGSPFLYLFLQEILGSQNIWFLNLLKIDLLTWNCILSIIDSDIPENIINIIEIMKNKIVYICINTFFINKYLKFGIYYIFF